MELNRKISTATKNAINIPLISFLYSCRPAIAFRPERLQRRLDRLVWRSPARSGRPPHLLSRKTTLPNSPSAATLGPGTSVNTCKQAHSRTKKRAEGFISASPSQRRAVIRSTKLDARKSVWSAKVLAHSSDLQGFGMKKQTFEADSTKVVFIAVERRESHLLPQVSQAPAARRHLLPRGDVGLATLGEKRSSPH